MNSGRPRVYLAGPDVFSPHSEEYFSLLTAICDTLGLEALPPFEETIPGTSPQAIYAKNMDMIRSAQGVIANLAPFRGGTEPDSGTAFEVGAATALGLPVVGYGARGIYADQVMKIHPLKRVNGALRDLDDFIVEDFGLQLNLMLACSVTLVDTAEQALQILAKILRP